MGDPERLDVVVVGAGYTGLAVLHLLRERGLSVRAYDAAGDVDGTWWWRGFPGARLDTEGHLHQYFCSEALVARLGLERALPGGLRGAPVDALVADRLDLRRDLRPGPGWSSARRPRTPPPSRRPVPLRAGTCAGRRCGSRRPRPRVRMGRVPAREE